MCLGSLGGECSSDLYGRVAVICMGLGRAESPGMQDRLESTAEGRSQPHKRRYPGYHVMFEYILVLDTVNKNIPFAC